MSPSDRSTRPPVRLLRAAVLALATAASGALALAPAASAAPRQSSAPADATIRAAHLSPDLPGVDVYVRSFSGQQAIFVSDANYGQISSYKQVPPGAYTFSIRRHGASMSTAPIQTWTLSAHPGYAYTAAVVGSGAQHHGIVLNDNLTPAAAGHANVRLIQASSRSGTANVVADNGPVIAKDARFATGTGYASVKAGTWPLTATGDGRTARSNVSLSSGSVDSLVLLDAPGGGTRLTSVLDAAGATSGAPANPTTGTMKGTAPKGSIDAGGGGTATARIDGNGTSGIAPVLTIAGSAALVLAFATLVLARRRRAAGLGRDGRR